MAEYSGFFNSTTSNQRKYSADDFTKLCLAIAGNGIAPSTALDSDTITGAHILALNPDTAELAIMGSNLEASIDSNKVKVQPGYSIAHGHWYSNSASTTLTPPSNSGYQWHVVCVFVDTTLKQANLAIKSAATSYDVNTALSNFNNTTFGNILPLGVFCTNNGAPMSSSFIDCRKPNTYRYPTMPTDDLPEDISVIAPAVGVSSEYARADHVHKFPYRIAAAGGSPVTTGIGTTASYGTSDALARADHRHDISAFLGTAKPLADSGTGVVGAQNKLAREDHKHPLNALPSGGNNGTASTYARSDHVHDISSLSQTSSYAFKSQAGFQIYKANSSFTDSNLIGSVAPGNYDEGPSIFVGLKDNSTSIQVGQGGIGLFTDLPSGLGMPSGLALQRVSDPDYGIAPMYNDTVRSWLGYLDASVRIAKSGSLEMRAFYDGRIHITGNVAIDIGSTSAKPYGQSGSMYYSPDAYTITLPTGTGTTRYYNHLVVDGTGRKWTGTIFPSQTYSPINEGIIGVCDVNFANTGSISFRTTSTKAVVPRMNLAFTVDIWGYSEYWK